MAWRLMFGFTACFAVAACAPSSPNKPDVLLITWDTVRADHVGDEWTPTWNRLASRAVVFENARTPAPITLTAHASIMTGKNPPEHEARDNGTWPLTEALPTLAERFKEGGWTTGAFISASVLDSHYGIGRGFSTYNDHIRPGKDRVVAHRTGAETVEHAIDWLLDKPPEQPVFLWVHLFDAHRPWEASKTPDTTNYQAAIAKADAATARLLEVMEARGRLESSIIAITSDHGEGLGEHDEQTHGYYAYDSTLRIPMLFWAGEHVSTRPPTQASRVTGVASLLDVATTLTAAAGLQPLDDGGVDLLAGPLAPRTLSFETVTPALDFDTAPIFGVIDDQGVAWFDTPTPERYQLDTDPKQLINRYKDVHRGQMAARMQQFPRRWPPGTDPMALDATEREALEALGYITRSARPTGNSTVDPKQRIDLFNLLTQTPDQSAHSLLIQADLMADKHGQVPALMLFKADLLDALARPVDALNVVVAASQAHPDDKDLAGELSARSQKLETLRRLAKAIQKELSETPKDLIGRRDLALTYHRLQRFGAAQAIYTAILKDKPFADDVRADFARMFASQQRYDTALSTLAPALRRPKHAAVVDCLAGQLMRRGLGQEEEAQRLLKYCE